MNQDEKLRMVASSDKPRFQRQQGLEQPSPDADIRLTKMGYEFDVVADRWQLDGSRNINFSGLSESVAPETLSGLRLALARYAEELSASAAMNAFARVKHFLSTTGVAQIDGDTLLNFRGTLDTDNEWWMGIIKGLLLSWIDWGYPGIHDPDEVHDVLAPMVIKGNRKGKAVRSACPHSGPYTDLEFSAIIVDAANLFQNQDITLSALTVLSLLAMTGRRPVQLRSLTVGDLDERSDKSGSVDYRLNIPRAKQRGGGFRSHFRNISINEDLYRLLEVQASDSIEMIQRSVKKKLTKKQRTSVPLFVHAKRVAELTNIADYDETRLRMPDYYHATYGYIPHLLSSVAKKSTARSERTDDYIHVNAYRFRYTYATRLRQRGASGAVLAWALDQTDTQQVDVYTKNTPEEMQAIDDALMPAMAPIAQAFAGRLIASEREATYANDPNKRIKNGNVDAFASCGSSAFCAIGYRACYTCSNFEPWVEGPHDAVLAELQAERERLREKGASEHVIASTDRTLLAVIQVIQMCDERKQARTQEKAANE